uniref:Uncharacterized protein n=1 Tax=Fagus sylvatica TaxID=28930 RepID=A0A2N9IFB7_FAGSY
MRPTTARASRGRVCHVCVWRSASPLAASDQPFSINVEDMDKRIEARIDGELLNGVSFLSLATMNKTITFSLLNETHIYTEESARFMHGHRVAYRR